MAPKAQAEPGTYLIRDIDPALWGRFKAKAERDGLPLRTLLLELVGAYASGAVTVEQTITVRSRGGK